MTSMSSDMPGARLRTAGQAWPGPLPPEEHDGRNGTRVASQARIGWPAH